MRVISFDTWLGRVPKRFVVRFLRDYVTDRVHDGMSKAVIERVLWDYGLKDQARTLINEIRFSPVVHSDFDKYGFRRYWL